MVPAVAASLLERQDELATLERLIEEVAAGSGRSIVVRGPAGIGKSSFLAEGAELARAAALDLLTASGGEIERELPWTVARGLLEPALRKIGGGEAEHILTGASRLALPILGRGHVRRAADEADSVSAALHGLYWLVADLSVRQPLALFVDDAHWADPPSLRWLAQLADRLSEVPVLLVVSVRTGDPAVEEELIDVLSLRSRTLSLRPLTEEATGELARRSLGEDPEPAFAQACHGVTRGNPFLIQELLRELEREGIRPVAETIGAVRELTPEGVSRAVLLRLARLTESARALAEAVAILGATVRVDLAAQLAGIDDATAASAADELVAADVLASGVALEFVHPLVRNAVYSQIGSRTRSRRHARAATVLAAAGARPEEVAAQLVSTEPTGDPGVVETLLRSANSALDRGAPDTAARYLRRALEEPPPRGERASVLRRLGAAESAASARAGAELLRQAFDASGDPTERAEIALEHSNLLRMVSEFRLPVELLQRALDGLGPEHPLLRRLEGELMNVAALDLSTLPIALERLAALWEAGVMSETDEPGILADLAIANVTWGQDLEGTLALAERAIAADAGERNPSVLVLAASTLAFCDRLESAREVWDDFVEDARKRGSRSRYAFACTFRSNVAYREGRVAAAEADARIARDTFAELGMDVGEAVGFLVDALMERADLDGARAALEAAGLPERPPEVWGFTWLLFSRGTLRLESGDPEGALADLTACGRRFEAWTCTNPAVVPWKSTTGLAHLALGEDEKAWALVQREMAEADVFGTRRARGIALRAAGLVRGGDEGVDLLERAVRTLRPSPARLEHARALCDLGAALRRHGRRKDAREPLREALDVATGCAATTIAQRARDELVAAGARPRRDVLHGRDALTASELRVAQMAASGMTNREIAQALFVSLRTVETHLTHAYQKLDLSSRAELAAALGRLGSRTG